ncbi:PepSY-associated TM helix domain-containing protein [Microbulbifer hainanensis]|uniref:PepSY-associated TM helix domain-containing protein n=1 Tax=Microbulbifer hainanensis TaxID=2735675 RepID=UPI001868C691|nr:PepSY-associated TM helix domain-containing protein [Microbulbifer hainanensis]
MLRKGIFWVHLVSGVVAGLVILMMSVTGVLLTYERQILAWSDSQHYSAQPAPGQERLPLDDLLAASLDSGFAPSSVSVSAEADAPLILRQGRAESRFMNPYTGEIYQPGSERLEEFFHAVVRWHRWFNAGNEHRGLARAITGACNLAFLFLVLSGLYLWLPAIYRWSTFRLRLWFHPNAKSGKARDFNWHHVFGFWMALPLAVIIATATVFNYSLANGLVFRLAGEEAPQRGRGGPPRGGRDDAPTALNREVSLENALQSAANQSAGWRSLTVELPRGDNTRVEVQVDCGTGGQPQKRSSLTIDGRSGEVLSAKSFSDQSTGRQWRSWIRFLHTGEALGFWGQTLAGLASLAAVLMVWTGLALSLRRFRAFLDRRRRRRADTAASPATDPA